MPSIPFLRPEVQDFINNNLTCDLPALILKGSPFNDVSIQELAIQIESKKKAKKKIPLWFESTNIIFPPELNLEQTSSEITAKYKASLVEGESLIDLTGGFGIDSFYFSTKFAQVTHCELNENLSDIASHNAVQLSAKKNITFIKGNGLDYLTNQDKKFDWIFVDPSRRDTAKRKVFLLADCQPDIVNHLDFLFSKTSQILVKTSPLLDIRLGITQLKYVEEIHVVAVNNDVKELLWRLSNKTNPEKIKVITVNFTSHQTQKFSSYLENETNAQVKYGMQPEFLYEPNAAILKAGFFNIIAERFPLTKLAKNSHLYTSSKQLNFPGRTFKIIAIYEFHKKIAKTIGLKKANITTRNFPISVADLRKKLRIKEGGNDYLFFSTNSAGKKMVVHGHKLKKNS